MEHVKAPGGRDAHFGRIPIGTEELIVSGELSSQRGQPAGVAPFGGFGRGGEDYHKSARGHLEATEQIATFGPAEASFDRFAAAIVMLLIENMTEHHDVFAGSAVRRSQG